MSTTAESSEPASELERLIADLPGSGLVAVMFGGDWWVAHLDGVTTHVFRGPANRRWWHFELGDGPARWQMDVRVDAITGVRFGRGPYPFPSSRTTVQPTRRVPQYQEPGRIATFFCMSQRERVPLRSAVSGQYTLCSEALTDRSPPPRTQVIPVD